MKQKRIFLLISFFLVASFIFGLALFNRDKSATDKNKYGQENYLEKKEGDNQLINKNKPEVKCEDNWEKYENDVLGLGFCYPKEWGGVFIEPIRDLSLLPGALDEYSKDEHNSYSHSLFVKFEEVEKGAFGKGGNRMELRIFNENYQGENYPNSRAYEKGYVDNIGDLKKTKNICDYRINFTELWEEQGRLTELWNQCEGRVKTRIINHEQYFDKSLYSYDLEAVSYLNLQNNFFDHVLIKKSYLHINQVEKKIGGFAQIFEAKNYPSAVDNSIVITQDEYDKEKEEFAQFINGVYSYAPIIIEKKDFQENKDEDEKITLIRKYYWMLENQKLEEAYQMHNRTNTSLEEFKTAQAKTRLAVARDFEKINDNTYKFFLDYQEHNKPKLVYRQTLRITNNKIEIITTEEITSEMVKIDNMVAYAKKQNGKNFVILEQYNVATVIDEGLADYDQAYSNLEAVKFFSDVKFSQSGKYLLYRMGGWEWSKNYVYDIEKMTQVLEYDSGLSGFDKDEKSYFVCRSAGMGSDATGIIYGVPEFKKKFELFKAGSNEIINVECKHDENKNELTFIYDNGCEENDENCKKYEVIYSFGEDRMLSSKALNN